MAIYASPYSLDIPELDLASFVFSHGTPETRRAPQYFDANQPARCYSLEEAELYVKRIALGLQQLGLRPDDKVLLYSNNNLFFPVSFWGVIASQCVFSACSPTASAKELAYQLRDSDSRILLTGVDGLDVAIAAAKEVGLSTDRIFIFGDPAQNLGQHAKQGVRPWSEFWASEAAASTWAWKRITDRQTLQSTTAILNYSSGTTGLPKGVEISHYNAVANSAQLMFKRNMVANTPSAKLRAERVARSDERWLAPLPMFHAYGQTYYCMNAPMANAKVYIMPKFNLDQMLLYTDIYRITFLTCVPTVLAMLAKHPNPEKFNLRAVESLLTGSAPLGAGLANLVRQTYFADTGIQIRQGWGMTETTGSGSGFALDDENDLHSVGWLNPNCKAKIVPRDQDFKQSVPEGLVAGELWIAGPNIMKGYYKRPEQTQDTLAFEDGERWLKTGDVAYVDKRGYIYIIDRLKELIKVKGLQVAPAEIEQMILEHPDVADVAVVGAERDDQEYVRAFIVKKAEAQNLSAADVFDFVKARAAPHKWLTGGVFFLDAIPRTGSGKVQRRLLPSLPVELPTKSKL